MRKANEAKSKDTIITVSANYVDLVIPDLLKKAFEVYNKKDFSRKSFQVSVLENANASAAYILTVLGFESYRNRIFYFEKKKPNRNVGWITASSPFTIARMCAYLYAFPILLYPVILSGIMFP